MNLYAIVTVVIVLGVGSVVWLLVRTWKAGWKEAADEVGGAKFNEGVRWGIAEAQGQMVDLEKQAYQRGLSEGVRLALAAPSAPKQLSAGGGQ